MDHRTASGGGDTAHAYAGQAAAGDPTPTYPGAASWPGFPACRDTAAASWAGPQLITQATLSGIAGIHRSHKPPTGRPRFPGPPWLARSDKTPPPPFYPGGQRLELDGWLRGQEWAALHG